MSKCHPAAQTRILEDRSNGYQSVSGRFLHARSLVGTPEVREWARIFSEGSAVLDLGCGHGIPMTRTLVEQGLAVYGVDASIDLLNQLRLRLPNVVTECNTVEESDFFGRSFDGVLAWGLMFLLQPGAQKLLVQKVSRALNRGGTFLFTAPQPACEWLDALTGRVSISLGAEIYREVLQAEGLDLTREMEDAGKNHYYLATKKSLQ